MKTLIASLLLLLGAQTWANESILLTPANTVTFRGPVDGKSTTEAMVKLTDLVKQRGKDKYPIYLVMDSPGGSIYAGDAFIQYAKTLPNVDTISIFSASMSSAIVQGLPGRRLVTPNGIQMFHRAKGNFEGQFETGEVESELELWKSIVRSMEQRSADRIGLTLEQYKAKIVNEWWIHGSDNVTQKVADAVVDIKCNQELVDTREVIEEQVFLFGFTSQFSGCPLFRAPLPNSKPKPEEE